MVFKFCILNGMLYHLILKVCKDGPYYLFNLVNSWINKKSSDFLMNILIFLLFIFVIYDVFKEIVGLGGTIQSIQER